MAHRLALAAVAATMATSAIVFTEPAPFDVLALGLLVLLPAVGLVGASPALLGYMAIMLVPVGCAFLGVLSAIDPSRALTHTAVSLFLMLVSFLVTAFVAQAPERHARLVLRGTVCAGLVAAVAGLAGYVGAFPGAYELFTLYGRVSGTFKDPNVFGAFLVMPATYLLHGALTARGRAMWLSLIGFALLAFGVLLSFSRGAWINLGMAAAIYVYFAFVTAPSMWQRTRLAIGFGGALIVGGFIVAAALQFDAVADLLAERATLSQSYDEGPEGRFGGQVKAKRLILAHPFGLGAQQFDPYYHLEEAHNVYLSMFMNAGWLGGLVFAAMVGTTVAYGAWHALQRRTAHGLFLVVYAAFTAHAFEGMVIDLDHWRHFHLLWALCWGLMLADGVPHASPMMNRLRRMSGAHQRRPAAVHAAVHMAS